MPHCSCCVLYATLSLFDCDYRRKTHAAVKAGQERLARQKEEQENKEKEERRRQYRERLHAVEQDDSEGEFDENDESFIKPVLAGGAIEHDNEDGVPSEEEAGSDDSSDDEEGEDMDEDAKLAELEMREQAMADQEAAEEEERTRVLARAEKAAAKLSERRDDTVQSEDEADGTVISDQEEGNSVYGTADVKSGLPDAATEATVSVSALAPEATAVDAVREDDDEQPVVKVRKAKNEKYIKMLMEDGKKKVVRVHLISYPAPLLPHATMLLYIRYRHLWPPFLTRKLRRRRKRDSRGVCWTSDSGRLAISSRLMKKRYAC